MERRTVAEPDLWTDWRDRDAQYEVRRWARSRGIELSETVLAEIDAELAQVSGKLIRFGFVDPADEIRYHAVLARHMMDWFVGEALKGIRDD
jgi:hypothetical protein